MNLDRRLGRLEQQTTPPQEWLLCYSHQAADGTVTDEGPAEKLLIDERCREKGYSRADRERIDWRILNVVFVEPPAFEREPASDDCGALGNLGARAKAIKGTYRNSCM